MKQAHRFSGEGKPYEGLTKQTKAGPQWTGKIRTVDAALTEPLKWWKPARVFVNSMSDLFHEGVSDEFIDRVFAVMHLSERHTFQILTKRPERMLVYMQTRTFCDPGYAAIWTEQGPKGRAGMLHGEKYRVPWPLPNVWLGVSVEDQKHADERIPLLLQTPAAIRFISAEPLLGPVDLTRLWRPEHDVFLNAVRGGHYSKPGEYVASAMWPKDVPHDRHLDWVIVGGESGPGARPFDLAWARSIVQQCQSAGVPVFYKQGGASNSCVHDRKGGCMECTPQDIRVREFPHGA